MNSLELANLICKTLSSRKAYDIVKIDVQEKTSVADYFIVASGRSSTQIKSLGEFCEEQVEKSGGKVVRKEGYGDARWIVIDFGDVILHLFNDETRLFYHLERLWGEGERIED